RISLKWANRSLPPPSGVMKPKPLPSLNHFTMPVWVLLLMPGNFLVRLRWGEDDRGGLATRRAQKQPRNPDNRELRPRPAEQALRERAGRGKKALVYRSRACRRHAMYQHPTPAMAATRAAAPDERPPAPGTWFLHDRPARPTRERHAGEPHPRV